MLRAGSTKAQVVLESGRELEGEEKAETGLPRRQEVSSRASVQEG